MSFTTDEIKTLKEMVKEKTQPKQYFNYSYKNQSCKIERELTLTELDNWKKRIDDLPNPLDPLILKLGHDEIHWAEGIIATAAAPGSYFATINNVWAAAPTKALIVTGLGDSAHLNYAYTRGGGRLNGAPTNFAYGNQTDGGDGVIYQISAVAQNVNFGLLAIVER